MTRPNPEPRTSNPGLARDTDHSAWFGPYPFRAVPDWTITRLLKTMDQHGVQKAWVGYLPSAWYRDAAAGNDTLLEAVGENAARLLPAPAVNPSWPGWEREIRRAVDARAPAIRTYPAHYGFATAGPAMAALAAACAEAGLVVQLTIRFEDGRQRSRLDVAGDLIGPDIRATVRAHPGVQVLVSGADRAIVEEVHWGSTAGESARIRWDICGIWGAPESHLAHLLATVGAERFVFGTQHPLRIYESALARLEYP